VNLNSRTEIRVECRDFRNLPRDHFAPILDLSDGFHFLDPLPVSGALDHIRHPVFQNPPDIDPPCSQWWLESGLDLVELMEYYLGGSARLYIFGEPYADGDLGVHNVHMNQGDPIDSDHAAENAIWQDGGILLEYLVPQPRLSVVLTKFETQSLTTDVDGHPI
jgi:hypothetical protein